MKLASGWRIVLAAFVVLAAAGCGENVISTQATPAPAVPTATQAAPTATATPPTPTAMATPPTPTPTEPQLGGAECEGDTCQHAHSTLVAIAHSNKDPTGTILYRVTVQDPNGQELSTGTDWGDGVNGFFYEVTAGGVTTTYIPFNGVGVDSNNRPTLRRFSFIVPASTSVSSLSVQACATNYQGGTSTTCTHSLWPNPDTYDELPQPDTAGPPWASVGTTSLEFESSDAVVVVNNGVYGGMVSLHVVDESSLSKPDIDLTTPGYAEWFAKHVVFLDGNVDVYTNDLASDNFAALPLDEAAYPVSPGSTMYRTKYGAMTTVESKPSQPAYVFYAQTPSTEQFGVAAKFLYDTPSSGGNLGGAAGTGSGAVLGDTSCGGETPCKVVGPQAPSSNISVIQEAEAGTQETRTICLTSGQQCYASPAGTCSAATNPLAVNTAAALNVPDYVIDRTIPNGNWGATFPPALYYVVPSGFGNCNQGSTPFCDRQSGFVGYVPHYLDLNGLTGSVGGGSTSEPLVGAFSLADEYALDQLSNSTQNRLIWFDNCGSGRIYYECSAGSSGCTGEQGPLGTRITLPSPPSGFSTYHYTINNKLPGAVVFSKECCASWYRANQVQQGNEQVTVKEPQQQIDNGYGIVLAPGRSLTYDTVFSDEAIVVYDATTGNTLYKLRLNPSAAQVYGCATAACTYAPLGEGCPSVTIASGSAANSHTINLDRTGQGSLVCAPIGDCPFGTTVGADGQFVTCTTTASNFLLGVQDWLAESPVPMDFVQVRAWGAAGNEGNENSGGGSGSGTRGSGGAGGFAMTVVTPSDLARDLFAYVGNFGGDESGGSSSILIPYALSSFTTDLSKVTNPALEGIETLVIAGGGGGGGSREADASGGDGGAGGEAISNSASIGSNSAVSKAGQDGNSKGCDGSNGYGRGGNKNALGEGGSGGEHSGGSGLGGTGGDNRWSYGSLVNSGSGAGNGGTVDPSRDGQGGGGGGFGAGGSGSDCGDGGGGGGAGSWAAANTVTDPTGPPYEPRPSSPGGSGGAVQLAYLAGKRPILYRVNAGGPRLDPTDDGPPWYPDATFLTAGGENTDTSSNGIDLKHHRLAPACPFNTPCGVPGAGAPAALFQTERWDPSGGAEMQYAFPVFSGDQLEIRLLLAETDASITKPGQRVFNVKVEGAAPANFNHIDQIAIAGFQYTGVMVSYVQTMADDTLNLEFDHVTENPAIKGIEIRILSHRVAARGMLTSTNHPFPIECLSAATDSGVILTNQNHSLVWQADGDLVLNNAMGQAIWRSNTSGQGVQLCFQSVGNLVVLPAQGSAIFASDTADAEHGNNGGTRLALGDDCNLTVDDFEDTVLFQTHTTCSSAALPTYTPAPTATRTPPPTASPTITATPPNTPTASHTPTPTRTITATRTITPTRTVTPTGTVTPTASFTPTASVGPTATATPQTVEVLTNELTSTNHPDPAACLQLPGDDGVVLDNGVAQLSWQSDGNLVLSQGGTMLWESATSDAELGGNGGRQLCFPNSLTIQNGAGTTLFSTQTLEGKTMRLDANCNLVITSVSGSVLFQTNTVCN